MTFTQALDYINTVNRLGSKPGLERIVHLLAQMDNPQRGMEYVHVAGTNGKGSTTLMTAQALARSGYKTGAFISPGVLDFCERMQINGKWIDFARVAKYIEQMIPLINRTAEETGSHPTEFEIMTALAFKWYKDEGCEIVVLEVGLGGRLDTTNVIDPPLAAAICAISLDHTAILGDSLDKIAYEKCGIIKKGSRVVSYCLQPNEARFVIEKTCASLCVPLEIPDTGALKIVDERLSGSVFEYGSESYETSMPGRHQIYNALTVIHIARALQGTAFEIETDALRAAIKETRVPGRQEIMRENPPVMVDGGHNADGIDRLCDTLDAFLRGRRLIAVMGILADKDYKYCIKQIASRAAVFIATQTENPRALSYGDCAGSASEYCGDVKTAATVKAAVALALKIAGDDCAVVICGSLTMVLPARDALKAP